MADRELQHLWAHTHIPVRDVGSLPWIEWSGTSSIPATGLCGDLPPDRRHLHALRPGTIAGAMGLVTVRHPLGPGSHRHRPGIHSPKVAAAVRDPLCGHGLAHRDRLAAAHAPPGAWRILVACRRGASLYGGHHLFIFDEKWRFGHEIWHLFVLAGSVAQYCAVLFYIGLAPVRVA